MKVALLTILFLGLAIATSFDESRIGSPTYIKVALTKDKTGCESGYICFCGVVGQPEKNEIPVHLGIVPTAQNKTKTFPVFLTLDWPEEFDKEHTSNYPNGTRVSLELTEISSDRKGFYVGTSWLYDDKTTFERIEGFSAWDSGTTNSLCFEKSVKKDKSDELWLGFMYYPYHDNLPEKAMSFVVATNVTNHPDVCSYLYELTEAFEIWKIVVICLCATFILCVFFWIILCCCGCCAACAAVCCGSSGNHPSDKGSLLKD